MLKFEFDRNQCTILNKGSLREMINACCTLVHELYCSMAKRDPELASAFRSKIQELMTSSDSPMWNASRMEDPYFELYMFSTGKKE